MGNRVSQICPTMGEITYLIVQGIITLFAFYLGAWVYYRGQMDRSPDLDYSFDDFEDIQVLWAHLAVSSMRFGYYPAEVMIAYA